MSEIEKQRRDELKRIPRGPRGSAQNIFRSIMWMLRAQPGTFEERVAIAISEIRKSEPSFVPRVLVV